MTGKATAERLSGEVIAALKFAAHRQLARWAAKDELSRHQRAQRTVLARAVRSLQDKAFVCGCELNAVPTPESADA
jgi:hypothetical protein